MTQNRKKGSISDEVKYEVAKELGVLERVMHDGDWGNVSSRNCGNIVKKTLEKMQRPNNS